MFRDPRPAPDASAGAGLCRSLAPLGKVVAIGGGTGLPAVLRALRQTSHAITGSDRSDWLTAIVTVMDDGGSSGRLRESLGVLPPGDIRNCLSALVRQRSTLSDIFHQRMPSASDEVGHPIGNLLLAALTNTEGDLLRAVQTLGRQLDISGRVLPATLENVHLTASFEDGSAIRGESAIAAKRGRIRRLTLERHVRPLPDSIEALVNADVIIVGPGSLYTSILPNLLVDGISSTISGLTAKRVYVANLMTEPGETDGFTLGDHLRVIREHVGFDLFDYVLVNKAPIPASALLHYASEGAELVRSPSGDLDGLRAQVVTAELANLTECGQIRHDPAALGEALASLACPERSRRATTSDFRLPASGRVSG